MNIYSGNAITLNDLKARNASSVEKVPYQSAITRLSEYEKNLKPVNIEYPYKEGRNGATTNSTPKKSEVLVIGAKKH